MSVPGCANKDESGLRMPQACSNKSDLRFERFVDPWPWAGAKTQTGLELVTFSVVKKNDRRQPGGMEGGGVSYSQQEEALRSFRAHHHIKQTCPHTRTR